MSRETDEDGFLSRWSRRKRTGEDDEEQVEPTVEQPAAPEEALTDEEILAKYNLPDPETLQPGDDFSAFLRAPLPRHLQQVALRKLWRSNPVFGVLDGLNEYDDDYTGGGVAKGALQTAYKVGRGFLNDEPDKEDAEAETPDAEVPDTLALDEDAETISEESPEVSDEHVDPDEGEPALIAEEDETPSGPTRRRMAFRFSDAD